MTTFQTTHLWSKQVSSSVHTASQALTLSRLLTPLPRNCTRCMHNPGASCLPARGREKLFYLLQSACWIYRRSLSAKCLTICLRCEREVTIIGFSWAGKRFKTSSELEDECADDDSLITRNYLLKVLHIVDNRRIYEWKIK